MTRGKKIKTRESGSEFVDERWAKRSDLFLLPNWPILLSRFWKVDTWRCGPQYLPFLQVVRFVVTFDFEWKALTCPCLSLTLSVFKEFIFYFFFISREDSK